MVRRCLLGVAVLLMVLLAALLNDSWLLYRAAYFLAVAAVFGIVWMALNRAGGIKTRFDTATPQVQAGDRLEINVSAESLSALPRLWLELALSLQRIGRPGSRGKAEPAFGKVLSLRSYDRKQWSFSTGPLQRGLYRLGPVTVTASDPLHLFQDRRESSDTREILVYPRTEDLPLYDPHREEKQGERRSRVSWDFFSFQAAGVRPYSYGDSLKQVHWPSTAKTGKLMVKVLEASTSNQTWLVLDMQESIHSPDGMSEESMISAVASVAKAIIESGAVVGLLYYDKERFCLAPSRGTDQLWEIMKALAQARATGRVPFDELIRSELQLLQPSFSCFFFTPSASPSLFQSFQEVTRLGCSVRVALADFPAPGVKSSVRDMESRLYEESVPVYRLSPDRPPAVAFDDRAPAAVGLKIAD